MPMSQPPLILAHRPAGPACISDVSVPAVGHFPRRLAPGTDARFAYQAVVIITAGRGSFQADHDPPQPVAPGCMWFLHPGVHYRYSPAPDASWEEFFIDLAGSGLGRWTRYGLLPRQKVVHHLNDIGRTVERLHALMSIMFEGADGAADRAVLKMEELLVDFLHQRDSSPSSSGDSHSVYAALGSIQRSYTKVIDWERLAESHAMSYMSLRRGIKRLTGRSPARYVNQLRCQVARRLLVETSLSIKEIGQSVGITHPVSFSRCFRREYGSGPEAFRLRVRGA